MLLWINVTSQECKREAVYSLASYVKNAAVQLNQETSKLRRLHCELQNIEEICKQLVLFMIEDRGTHWRDYESLFLLLMVMVKPLFHRVLQYEEFPVMIKAIEKLREYIHEILLCAKRIMGFFSSGEREALDCFMKASEEWLSHFAGDDESSKLDDTFIPDDEDVHLKYNFLTRRLRKNPNCDVKEKILGKNYHQRKHKNVEEYHASNCNEVTLVEHPFKQVIPYITRPKHSSNPKGLFMEFYHEEKTFNETPQRLYMLQTVMIYVVDTQKKVQIDETRILQLRDEFETIEEALIQDWMVDVGDKISAFETCERIEESQRFNNVLPDNEVLYSRIMRRIQKLRNNESDEIDVWNSCHYHRDLGFSRPSIVAIDSRLSNDDEPNCDRKDSRLKLRGGGVATEVCQLKVFASVDSQADSAKCCYAHPVLSGDLQASVPSAKGNEETGTNKRNTGQGDVCVTEKKQEENPAQNSVTNIVLDMVNSKQSQMSLDMAIVMWICALLYFWKHMAGVD